MGTVIEFPADAASRLGSTTDRAPVRGTGTVATPSVVRIDRQTDERGSGPEDMPLGRRRRRRARFLILRIQPMSERPLERFRAKWMPVRVKKTCQIKRGWEPGFHSINAGMAPVMLGRACTFPLLFACPRHYLRLLARGLQRRRFRAHPGGLSQRRHAQLGRPRGRGKHRRASLALPAHRRRATASRSRLSPDRAAAFASRLEERIRRLPADRTAVAADRRRSIAQLTGAR